MKIKYFLFSLALVCIMGSTWPWPFSLFFTSPEKVGSSTWINNNVAAIHYQATNLNPKILRLGLTAYVKARQDGLAKKELLTIIDYSKPSTEKRLWVIDLRMKKVLFNTWVTHGRNSGGATATSFSNQPGSLKSSLGVFLTDGEPYMGGNGYSLRMLGLENGFNHNAYRRDIVFHGAWYANPAIIRSHGQLGRSWGCPAVGENVAKPLINTIKNRSLVFAYYPDRQWLRRSVFLTA